jgi:hypothetical protein
MTKTHSLARLIQSVPAHITAYDQTQTRARLRAQEWISEQRTPQPHPPLPHPSNPPFHPLPSPTLHLTHTKQPAKQPASAPVPPPPRNDDKPSTSEVRRRRKVLPVPPPPLSRPPPAAGLPIAAAWVLQPVSSAGWVGGEERRERDRVLPTPRDSAAPVTANKK